MGTDWPVFDKETLIMLRRIYGEQPDDTVCPECNAPWSHCDCVERDVT